MNAIDRIRPDRNPEPEPELPRVVIPIDDEEAAAWDEEVRRREAETSR